ncbi:MAG: hypothetical protein ABIJ00_11735 [Candidatus Eisenbacteria bacterium]
MTRKNTKRDILIGLLVLGSIWGFLEVVVGGGMKAASIPYKGDILTGLGIGIMAVAVAAFRKPLMLIGIAAIAIAVRQTAIPILHLSTFCKANSCLAVMLGGTTLAGCVAIAGRRLQRGTLPRVVTGFSAGLLAASSFYFIGMRVAPCRYLLSFNRAGGFVSFMIAEGLIWAALGSLFFPAGYRLGERVRDGIAAFRIRRPVFYYTASVLVIACCWVVSSLAIAGGF